MTLSDTTTQPASVSDGSTASYYELPAGATELQDLISHRNMNAQDGEIFRAIYRKGRASHSDELRDAKKVLFYAAAEVDRLEALRMPADFGHQYQLNTASFTDGGFTGRGRSSRVPTGGVMIHCPDCSADSCPCVSR